MLTGSNGDRIVLANQNVNFRTGPNRRISSTGVIHQFIPTSNGSPSRVTRRITKVPPRVVHLIASTVGHANLGRRTSERPTLILTLSSRVYNTVHQSRGGRAVRCPLRTRIHSLCTDRCTGNGTLISTVGACLNNTLPSYRTITLTLRLIGTNFSANSLSTACAVANIVRRVLAIVRNCCNVALSRGDIGITHFVARLHCLFIHVRRRRRLSSRPRPVIRSVGASCPGTSSYTGGLTVVIGVQLGIDLSRTRVTCLALRITQIASRTARSRRGSSVGT